MPHRICGSLWDLINVFALVCVRCNAKQMQNYLNLPVFDLSQRNGNYRGWRTKFYFVIFVTLHNVCSIFQESGWPAHAPIRKLCRIIIPSL